jgi:hypothetical protein
MPYDDDDAKETGVAGTRLGRITGSHGGEYENDSLLGYSLVEIYRRFRDACFIHLQGDGADLSEHCTVVQSGILQSLDSWSV